MPTKNNAVLKTSDALKGFLFRAYNACRCNHVGQALPDDKGRSLPSRGGRCPVRTDEGGKSFPSPLAFFSAYRHLLCPPCGGSTAQPGRGVIISHASSSFGEGGRRQREGLSHGFTLLELLVVVLIIGILAAIAVPQYQKAVEKARLSEALIILHAIAQANKLYFLTNGIYTSDIQALDVKIKGTPVIQDGMPRVETKFFRYGSKGTGVSSIAVAQRLPAIKKYVLHLYPDGVSCCYGYPQGLDFCKSISGGKKDSSKNSWGMDCYVVDFK